MLERDLEMLFAAKGIKKGAIAEKVGESKQNIGAKFNRETLREKDVKKLLDVAGISAEIIYTDNENKKEIFRRKI